MSTTEPERNSMTTGETLQTATRRRRRRRWGIGRPIPRGTYIAVAVLSFLVALGLWWFVTAVGLANPRFLPGPGQIVKRLLEQAGNGQLWADLGASTYRIAVGYLIASAMALPLGVIPGVFRIGEAIIEPLVDFIRYMPVVAFVPLTILWVGTGDSQKFLIIWMGTFFQQVLMVSADVQRVPKDLINLGRTLGMSDFPIIWRIIIPSAAPDIWNTLRITMGWAWTWLVVAELVAATSGLGYRITVAQRYLSTDLIIAYVLVLGVIGLIVDQTMRALGRWMFRFKETGR